MALTQKHIQNVCLAWTGHKQCRYLGFSDTGAGHCLKLVPKLKAEIDKEVEKFKKTAKQNGQSVPTLNRAVGDNCKGYVYTLHLKQGYDLDQKKKN
jgi:hypothetical protein